ncbi:hypothetical protein QJS04_geneDACA016364 [Acorus gramineus]|uniref:Uncharacterized protein n=1 Tax=Acorus gramineus TaxID=55184 RepID=A0AAV9AUT3_ACOGR|nr:hypothetical protein QJS04_geneDACA016364 [Acorus gramineus]
MVVTVMVVVVDATIVTCGHCERYGHEKARCIQLYPHLMRPRKVELRRELGMDDDLPAVLLMGGGEGMGPIEATARALGNALYDDNLGEPIGHILVICGQNKKLANRLQGN